MRKALHLVRRTWLSLVDRRLRPGDIDFVRSVLTDREFSVWSEMGDIDRRHSVRVLHRFDHRLGDATRDERAAVLLHDVGKTIARLGTLRRIGATLGLDRSERGRLYRRHEELGVELLVAAGVQQAVVTCLRGEARAEVRAAFSWADDE